MDQVFCYSELSHNATIANRVVERPLQEARLNIPERRIQELSQRFAPTRALIPAVLKQCWVEWLSRIIRGANIRTLDNRHVLKAYEKLTPNELRSVNMRQHWAAWRAIPRSLSSVVVDQPVAAIDLCCGLGESTRILAHFLTPGSRILGIDFDARFIRHAQNAPSTRTDRCDYRVQSVLAPWHDQDGVLVPDMSVGLVHSIGALAFHFTRFEIEIIVKNAWRVLRRGGALVLDMRRFGRERIQLLKSISAGGFKHVKSASSCLLDRTTQESFLRL